MKTPVVKSLLDLQLYQKETPTQMFFYGFCEIFERTYFEGHLQATASGRCILLPNMNLNLIVCNPSSTSDRKPLIFSWGIEINQWHEMC